MVQMNLSAKQKERQMWENKCMDTKARMKGGLNWEMGIEIYTLFCV